MSEHALYRFYGHDNELLYVGITLNPTQRWRGHQRDKPWWADITRISLERYPDRAAVLAAERLAIETEHPQHNVIYNGTHRVRESEPAWTAEDMPDLCHDHCVREHGDCTMYFPHRWVRGKAEYTCLRGHHWTCGWGHEGTGTAKLPPVPDPATPVTASCGHSVLEPGVGLSAGWCGCRPEQPLTRG